MSETNKPKRPFLIRLWVNFWASVTWLRVALFNLIFLFIVLAVFAGVFADQNMKMPEKAPLLIAPSGTLVDQLTYLSPQQQLLGGGDEGNAETLVHDTVHLINSAANDPRISGIILKLDNLDGGGLSKMQEIGAALQRFAANGKPVIASADYYTQGQYFLASYANEIYLHDLGGIELTGFAIYRNYFKQALDKLAVKFHVFKVGTFKDFVEPYIRDDMSAESREHNSQWLNELWTAYATQVETQRKLAPGSLTQAINSLETQLRTLHGNTAEWALSTGLVDHVGSRKERLNALIERFGADPEDKEQPLFVSEAAYRHHLQIKPLARANIALIVASGTILDGHHPEGTIGSDTLSEIIRKAREDKNIKALVLRIDSGGGSAFASEVIRNELQTTRALGIPIVVSMGSVAASGGYWIAMAADQIWATPTTITGSIGVFGLFPTIDQTLTKLGVHTDGMGTTNLAGAISIDRPLSDEAANILQLGVEHIYSRFLAIVAENRKSTPAAIDEIAQGRVWTGQRAKELGLVDNLGSLDDAIDAAAKLAGLAQYEPKLFERDLSPQEQFMRELFSQVNTSDALQSTLSHWTGIDLATLKSISRIVREQSPITTALDGPRTTYALCVSCLAL
jgi:protease IV